MAGAVSSVGGPLLLPAPPQISCYPPFHEADSYLIFKASFSLTSSVDPSLTRPLQASLKAKERLLKERERSANGKKTLMGQLLLEKRMASGAQPTSKEEGSFILRDWNSDGKH